MIIEDYINLWGENPLIGPNDERFGVRFPDMSEPYSKELIAKAESVATELGIDCKKGVYALFSGPCFESAAEIRAYAVLGADVAGMSTVPETIAANYLGLKVFGLSCITNMATGIATVKHDHHEVLRIANESSENLCNLVAGMLKNWNK
jgi:purine-nucleoside phosphorylase